MLQRKPEPTVAPMILLESEERWILTPTPDPRLGLGSVVQLAGTLWLVTWDSRHGFGAATLH